MFGQPWQLPQNIPMFNQQMFNQPVAQTIPPQQSSSLYGRMIASLDDKTPNDVPSDGSLGVFPLYDGSAIYTKRLKGDGSTEVVEYRPTSKARPICTPVEEELFKRVDALEQRLAQREEHYEPRRTVSTNTQAESSSYERPIQETNGRSDYEQRQQSWRADSSQPMRDIRIESSRDDEASRLQY